MTAITAEAANQPSLRQRMLQPEAWRLAFILSVAPNILFLAAMPFFVAVRPVSPMLYFFAGLISLRFSGFLAYILFLLASVLDFAFVVAVAFNLPFNTAVRSVHYLATIDAAASLFYILIAMLFLANGLATAWFLNHNRHQYRLKNMSLLPAALMAIAVWFVDSQVNEPYLKQSAPYFESAASLNGITADAVAAKKRNLLVVMVEGMGSYANPEHRDLLRSKFEALANAGRFDLVSGTSNFEGSTTGAESRELCGQWGDFSDYLTSESYDCLPRQLSKRGYKTIAYHGYSHEMFARDRWYPAIGFTESHFMEDLRTDRAKFPELCGSVFRGLCDVDMAKTVSQRLKREPSNPKMVYWLTLDSHIPYVPPTGSPFRCETEAALIDNKRVCELTAIWGRVFDSVVGIANDPDIPPTDILVVGDHSTPLWERPAARHFIPGKVDWYQLSASDRPMSRPSQP